MNILLADPISMVFRHETMRIDSCCTTIIWEFHLDNKTNVA